MAAAETPYTKYLKTLPRLTPESPGCMTRQLACRDHEYEIWGYVRRSMRKPSDLPVDVVFAIEDVVTGALLPLGGTMEAPVVLKLSEPEYERVYRFYFDQYIRCCSDSRLTYYMCSRCNPTAVHFAFTYMHLGHQMKRPNRMIWVPFPEELDWMTIIAAVAAEIRRNGWNKAETLTRLLDRADYLDQQKVIDFVDNSVKKHSDPDERKIELEAAANHSRTFSLADFIVTKPSRNRRRGKK